MSESPIPWTATHYERTGVSAVMASNGEEVSFLYNGIQVFSPEDARLIVKAVNNHDKLVNALDACRATLALMLFRMPECDLENIKHFAETLNAIVAEAKR